MSTTYEKIMCTIYSLIIILSAIAVYFGIVALASKWANDTVTPNAVQTVERSYNNNYTNNSK